jgi:hypothetical protein
VGVVLECQPVVVSTGTAGSGSPGTEVLSLGHGPGGQRLEQGGGCGVASAGTRGRQAGCQGGVAGGVQGGARISVQLSHLSAWHSSMSAVCT